MSTKKSQSRTRAHFEPSTLLPVAGGSKPKAAFKGAPEQANKLLTSSQPSTRKSRSSAIIWEKRAAKRISKAEWDRIWSQMLCIECFKEGKEVRGTSREHPQHVTEDVSVTKEGLLSLSAAGHSGHPKSQTKERGQHSRKSMAVKPGAEQDLERPGSQIMGGSVRWPRAYQSGSSEGDISSHRDEMWMGRRRSALHALDMADEQDIRERFAELGGSERDLTVEMGTINAILNYSRGLYMG